MDVLYKPKCSNTERELDFSKTLQYQGKNRSF